MQTTVDEHPRPGARPQPPLSLGSGPSLSKRLTGAFFITGSLFGLLLTYGFHTTRFVQYATDGFLVAAAVFFSSELIVGIWRTKHLPAYLRENWLGIGAGAVTVFLEFVIFVDVVIAGDTALLRSFQVTEVHRVFVGVIELYVLVLLLEKAVESALGLASVGDRPNITMAASFVLLIFLGAFLLLLPKATVDGISWIDALFTSTTAVCVTGLSTVGIGTTFTLTGKIILLILIQIGGLGLITFVTFFGVLFGRGLGLAEKAAIQEILHVSIISDLTRLVRYVIGATFVFEIAGAVLLYQVFADQQGSGRDSALFSAIFHSVSAFNNAGLSVYDANLVGFERSPLLMLTMMTLIFFGGIGFYVIMDMGDHLFRRKSKARRRLGVQARLALLVSGLLVLMGGAVFWSLEAPRMTVYPAWNQALISLFHSTASRTAGFHTLATDNWDAATYFFVAILMFIGASPGGTGGGIKTVTAGVLAGFVISTLSGRPNVEMFRRTISIRAVRYSGAIIVLSFAFVCTMTFLLSLTENAPFIAILFETVSAFGTVGFSAGLTPLLSTAGKLILSFTMLVGRIGPLSLAIGIATSSEGTAYKYPDEDIMVG